MREWVKFVPGKEHIGLRARFRKVVGDKVEEVVGTIVADPCHNPWQYDVEIICDEDKRRLPFPNGECPFYDDRMASDIISEIRLRWNIIIHP